MSEMNVLIVGCGGIGGVLATTLAAQRDTLNLNVVGLSRNPVINAAIRERGLELVDEDDRVHLPFVVHEDLREAGVPERSFDYVFLCMQPPNVEQAALWALPWLAPDGAMVVFPNGLLEERVAAIAGPERTLGGVIAWGAAMPRPGVYEKTSEGGFVVGALVPTGRGRLERLVPLLELVGPVEVTDNLRGARWSKLAINCAISTLGTIGGDQLGALMRHRFVRRLALEIMTEVVDVARAADVRLEKVSGTIDLDWVALTAQERRSRGSASLVSKHTLLLAVGARYRRLRSSMLAQIERGRAPSVDFLNGEVVDRGRTLGIPTPVNEAATRMVHAIARGEQRPGLTLLRELAATADA